MSIKQKLKEYFRYAEFESYYGAALAAAVVILAIAVWGKDVPDLAVQAETIVSYVLLTLSAIAIIGVLVFANDPNKDWLRVVALILAFAYLSWTAAQVNTYRYNLRFTQHKTASS